MVKKAEYDDHCEKSIGCIYNSSKTNEPGTHVADWSGLLLRFPDLRHSWKGNYICNQNFRKPFRTT